MQLCTRHFIYNVWWYKQRLQLLNAILQWILAAFADKNCKEWCIFFQCVRSVWFSYILYTSLYTSMRVYLVELVWPWPPHDLDTRSWPMYSEKMKFVGQGIRKLKYMQDRETHTDATECISRPHSRLVYVDILSVNCRLVVLQYERQPMRFCVCHCTGDTVWYVAAEDAYWTSRVPDAAAQSTWSTASSHCPSGLSRNFCPISCIFVKRKMACLRLEATVVAVTLYCFRLQDD